MGMKVFTDSESQFHARIFQPTASSLKMEPKQTVAANLYMTPRNSTSASLLRSYVKQTVAADLKMEPKQTVAANLYMTPRNSTNHVLLKTQVFQSVASNLQVTFSQTTASNLQTTLANRGTLDASAALGLTHSTTFNYGAAQTVITLSKFSFLIKGGTAATNVKLQLSPIGGTVAANWIDDDTVVRTLAAAAITILTPTRFSKYARLAAKQSGATSATLTLYYQGQV